MTNLFAERRFKSISYSARNKEKSPFKSLNQTLQLNTQSGFQIVDSNKQAKMSTTHLQTVCSLKKQQVATILAPSVIEANVTEQLYAELKRQVKEKKLRNKKVIAETK